MADNRISLIISAVDNTSTAFKNLQGNLNKLSTQVAIASAKFIAIKAAIEQIGSALVNSIKPAYDAVEKYNMAVTKMAAMITSFSTEKSDLSAQYKKSKDYAEMLVEKLEEIDAKTVASADDLSVMTEEMLKQGVLLDVNNQKQLEAFTNIANAAAVIAQGTGQKEIQIRQEIRALMEGQVDMHSQLAQQINALVGGSLKEKVELWKKEGTIIEHIGELLQGYAAASKDIEGTWSAIGSTLESIKNRILRSGFSDVYLEINSHLQSINEYLKEHGDYISTVIRQTWLSIKGILETIGNLFDGFLPILRPVGESIAFIANGLGLVAYTILPPLSERIGYIIKSMFEWVALVGNIGNAFYKLLHFDFEGAAKEASEAKENFRQSGIYIGKAFAGGFGDEVSKRYDEYTKTIGGKKKTVEAPKITGFGGENLKKLAEDWKKVLRDLQTDIAKTAPGLDEFDQKIEDIKNKAADLREKFSKIPGALKEINAWQEKMTKHIEWEKQWKDYEAKQKRREDAEKKYAELVDTLQTSTANEVENRIQKSIQDETKLTKELGEIWFEGVITYEEYQRRLKEIEKKGSRERAKIREEFELQQLESESRRRLALLDLAEKEMSISKEDIARGRIAEYEKMLSYYENIRQKAIEAGDITARIQAEDKIAEINTKLNELNMTMKELTGSFTEGWARGLTEYLYNLKTTFQLARDMAVDTAQAMQQAFSDFFFDAFEGKMKSLADYLNSFLSSVKRALANVLGQQVTGAIVRGIGGFFGGSPSASPSASPLSSYENAILVHSGGFPHEARQFRLIPRFHTGVGPDEVLSVIRKDEAVFTPGQMKALGAMISKSPNVDVNINIENRTGVDIEKKNVRVQTKWDGQRMIKDILIELLNRDKTIQDALGVKPI